ncbi:hypothetical protein Pint_25904 [Pistacia integerrima]|uniref:Uncharacterized protein n=1 Tax=Pistacia integerrima TaxID=434235 RepID=A0ACC0YB38_9ROSI|nr:hypothetical protein Pint_25904 [Pistacia integerrima]
MVVLLLRHRKASASGISSILRGHVESFGQNRETKFGALVAVDVMIKNRPHTWYPCARNKIRKVVLHVGPTNSGKTHQLKRLESSSTAIQNWPTSCFSFLPYTGIYCGPLRLLAWEVAKRLNKANVPCDLITGQEREEVDGAKLFISPLILESSFFVCLMSLCTFPFQMLGCRTRGFSFTRALLGISADELHLWGDQAAIPLIQEILKSNW